MQRAGLNIKALNHLPTGQVPLQFDLPECKIYLPETLVTQRVTFKSFNVRLSFLCGIYYSKPRCPHISRNKNKTLIRTFLIFLLAPSGYKKGAGGACKDFLPEKRGGGGEISFSHAEGGAQKFWGSFYAVA